MFFSKHRLNVSEIELIVLVFLSLITNVISTVERQKGLTAGHLYIPVHLDPFASLDLANDIMLLPP